MEILYSLYASLQGIPLEDVSIVLHGHHDARAMLNLTDGAPGLDDVRFDTVIRSTASEEDIRKLRDLVEHRSPILDTLRRPVSVTGTLSLNGQPLV